MFPSFLFFDSFVSKVAHNRVKMRSFQPMCGSTDSYVEERLTIV